jgi:hypothetical protein
MSRKLMSVRPAHLPWLPAEARVADRYVRALLSGRYASAREAVPDCQRALDRLRTRALARGESLPFRGSRAVWCRISKLALNAGRPPRGVRYTREERQLFSSHAQQLMDGKYRDTGAAGQACLQAHEKMRAGLSSPLPARPLHRICRAIAKAARALGRLPARDRWTPDELRVVKRYARGVTSGRYKQLEEAARACRAELAGRHTAGSTSVRIRSHAVELGWTGACTGWSDSENKIADRFARAIIDGRYPGCVAATDDCLRALKKAGAIHRSRVKVFQKLAHRTRTLGRKTRLTEWARDELAVIEPYARRLAAGEFHSGYEAASECHKALARAGFKLRSVSGVRTRVLKVARALGRENPHVTWTDREKARIDRIARSYAAREFPNITSAAEAAGRLLGSSQAGRPRSLASIVPILLARAHELGRPEYRRYWSPAENQRCDSWIRWYERHRRVRRYRPAQEAVLGLHEELERLSSDRTRGACSGHFYWRRRQLLARSIASRPI